MAIADSKTFRCEVIGPTGKLLDCRTTSVVFPAHDGQVGVLCDHMPMLSQLGLGLLRVAPPSGTDRAGAETRSEVDFFVDGGFALVAENSITIVAYDALALQDVKAETIESLVARATRHLASATLSEAQKAHERERRRALQRIAGSLQG